MSKNVDEIIVELKAMLADKRLPALPWTYGACIIEPRISKEWPIDAKTLARAAVNALPILIAEIERLRKND